MTDKEFVVTGQLKETNGQEKQMLILHRSFFTTSKEQAIRNFHDYFGPDLEVVKIYSVVDNNGNIL